MKRIASALIVVAGFLQGCGGGGGGNANTGGQSPVTSHSIVASVSGLDGTLALVLNSEAAVSISSNTRATLARLPAGTSYTISVTSQPTSQHCTLSASSGTLTADVTIDVMCASHITTTKSTVSGFEVARFDVANLDLQQSEYSGSIDGSIGVTLAAVEGGLVVLIPPLIDGAHRLEVLIDGVRHPIDFNISTPALPAPAAHITSQFLTEIEDGLAAMRADPVFATLSDWTAIDDEVAALKAQLASMGAADLDALARMISLNQYTTSDAFAKSSRSPLMMKYNDAGCLDLHRRLTSNLIDTVAYVSASLAFAAVGVEFGPYGVVIGAAAAGTMYVLKGWPALQALWENKKEYGVAQCFAFQRLNFDLKLEERFSIQKAGRSAHSMAMTQQTLTFNHKRTREYDVTGSGVLSEDIRESASLATKMLRLASPFLSDETKALLQGWTASFTRPVNLSDFVLSNVTNSSIEGTLSVQAGMLRLRFAYLPDQMPAAPVDFTFTLSGNNQSWQIPARLNVIEPPLALPDDVTTQSNEMLRSALKADFAESFRISQQPVNGTITLDETSGVYEYMPNLDFTGADSFQFTAANARGESTPATVGITIAGLCEVSVVVNSVDRICYTDMERTTIDSTEFLSSAPGFLQVQHAKVVQLIPGDSTSIRHAQSYRYIVWDHSTTVQLENIDWVFLPGTTVITEISDERANVEYASGAPIQLSWSKSTKNLASMTGARESISCKDGLYTWYVTSTTIDPVTGAIYDQSHSRTDVNVPGACPKTAEEMQAFLPPLPIEDIRAWQIWNAMQ